MKNQSCSRRVTLSILSISILFTSNAWGAIHGWDVHEVFSNEDGTIQFVELVEALGLNGENLFANRALISDGAIVVTLANIAFQTANKKYLFATAGAAALPDFPTPDFALPDGFLNTAGDTIKFCQNVTCSLPIDTFIYVTPLPTYVGLLLLCVGFFLRSRPFCARSGIRTPAETYSLQTGMRFMIYRAN